MEVKAEAAAVLHQGASYNHYSLAVSVLCSKASSCAQTLRSQQWSAMELPSLGLTAIKKGMQQCTWLRTTRKRAHCVAGINKDFPSTQGEETRLQDRQKKQWVCLHPPCPLFFFNPSFQGLPESWLPWLEINWA